MARDLSELDKAASQYGGTTGGGSDFFKFKQGKNIIRILNFPEVLATHFIGGRGGTAVICIGIDEGCKYHGDEAVKDEKGEEKKPSLKLVSYVIDRADGTIKLAELPLSIRYALKDLQETDGFEFSDFPLPYDVQIIHDPDNKDPKAKYRMTGIPKMTPLSKEEQEMFDKVMERMTPEQYVEKRKSKVRGEPSTSSPMQQTASAPKPVDYPTEEINPDDIPF